MTCNSRPIHYRTAGYAMGPIIRLISPGDVGEIVKPFVFLDLFEMTATDRRGFVPHPHSGIATLTAFFEGHMTYGDTTGKRGAMAEGSVEWMRAGSGVWHAGEPSPGHKMRGFQLWIALPPELELATAESLYLDADDIPETGPARILLGSYAGKRSDVPYPPSITYLHVRLKNGEHWRYLPAADHDIAWLAVGQGALETAGTRVERELSVFADGTDPIDVIAHGDTEFVIGSAPRHPHPLVIGNSSVHTSGDALAQGEQTISALRRSDAFAALAAR